MKAITPVHQWTHDGDDVLVLRWVYPDGTSSRGFCYPLTVGATVEAPDWNPRPECGRGLHGWPWGFWFGIGSYPPSMDVPFLVIGAAPADVVAIDDKCKLRRGVVRHIGTLASAMQYLADGRAAWIASHSATTGDRANSATTGTGAHSATTGDGAYSTTTGVWAHSTTTGKEAHSATTGAGAHSATTGNGAHSTTTGARAHSATTGAGAHSATTGADSVAVALGRAGRAKAGPNGAVVLVDYLTGHPRPVVGIVGEDGIEAGVWYRVANGRLVRDEDQV